MIAPLHRARILRLVDENVVDALIELVVNPAADIAARQQRRGAVDQVVEIELAAAFLDVLVVAVQPVGKR